MRPWSARPKQVVTAGKTPVLCAQETRALLDSIDGTNLAGLRDQALLGILVHSFARVAAAVSMRVGDYYTQGSRVYFRYHEKGGRYTGNRPSLGCRTIAHPKALLSPVEATNAGCGKSAPVLSKWRPTP